ncbi:MAG: threonine aldolase [Alphaproteobacteria bacterium]|nr:threonine aldolase [Alphaproteobacteria bacterium]
MLEALRLHGDLIGKQGSRRRLNTPALVIDIEALDANIAAMAEFARRHKVALRPHSKTHKSADIARRQIKAGALGVCCAKLGEAEALSEAGIGGLHITSAVVTPQGIERLMALNAATRGLSMVADDGQNIDALDRAAAAAKQKLNVILDIDPGMHRTGVWNDADVMALAKRIGACKALHFAGVQFYSGRLQHVEAYAERLKSVLEQTARLARLVNELRQAGMPPAIVTGSGTGTHQIDATQGVFTELQVGSYVFMDTQYEAVDLHGDKSQPFKQALQIDSTIISANSPGLATADAGLKAFATDGPAPVLMKGAPEGSSYRFFGDEYGAVVLPEGKQLPIGSTITCQPPHCDPTVNLYEAYHVVKGDTLVDIWPVTARGRSR